ncbi:MAG: hypothetical protein HY784_01360 [Chloroflexi bacterium]|nr:hypothetical protein [Chloroflexota bacterium]
MSETIAYPALDTDRAAGAIMAYEAVVEHGHIRAPAGIPDGIQVYIVVPAVRKRPAPGTAEWRQPFDAFDAFVHRAPAPLSIDTLSDEELNAIVHEARGGLHAPSGGD